jgi:hypothetical protein
MDSVFFDANVCLLSIIFALWDFIFQFSVIDRVLYWASMTFFNLFLEIRDCDVSSCVNVKSPTKNETVLEVLSPLPVVASVLQSSRRRKRRDILSISAVMSQTRNAVSPSCLTIQPPLFPCDRRWCLLLYRHWHKLWEMTDEMKRNIQDKMIRREADHKKFESCWAKRVVCGGKTHQKSGKSVEFVVTGFVDSFTVICVACLDVFSHLWLSFPFIHDQHQKSLSLLSHQLSLQTNIVEKSWQDIWLEKREIQREEVNIETRYVTPSSKMNMWK